jgi:hypothetical protein
MRLNLVPPPQGLFKSQRTQAQALERPSLHITAAKSLDRWKVRRTP